MERGGTCHDVESIVIDGKIANVTLLEVDFGKLPAGFSGEVDGGRIDVDAGHLDIPAMIARMVDDGAGDVGCARREVENAERFVAVLCGDTIE